MSVTEIVISAQKGDKAALQQLYDMYVSEVYVVVQNIVRNEHEAEDITHDVFVTVIEKISELRSPESFHSWLRTVTINKCRKFLRDRHDYVTDDNDMNGIEVIANTETGDFTDILPCEHLDQNETNKILYKAISELSEKHKTVIFMHYYCDMSIERIGEELGISVGTVKSRLSYARKTLEKKLTSYEKYGIRLHSLDIFSGFGNIISNISHTAQIPKTLYSALHTVTCTSNTAFSSAISSMTAHTISHATATKISVSTSAAAVITACTVLVTSSSPPPETPQTESLPVSETMQVLESSPESSAESAAERIIEKYIERSLEPVVIKETSVIHETLTQTSVITETSIIEVEKEVEKIITNTEYVEVERQKPQKNFSEYTTAEDDNYKYIIYPSVNEAVLTQVKNDNSLTENITVPDSVDGIPVTEIGSNAFKNMLSLVSVTLPDSIKTISPCAFEWCSHLESIEFGNSLETIGMCAFYHCGLKSAVFPETLRSVGMSAFSSCPLDEVTFGDDIQEIASNAFSSTNITELDFGNAPVTIASDAFKKCVQLQKIRFSPFTQFVMDDFSTCTALEEIQLFYNDINFWNYSDKMKYKGMPALKKIDITVCDGVKNIDNKFFQNFGVDIYIHIINKPNGGYMYSNVLPCNIPEEIGEFADDERMEFCHDYTLIDTTSDEFSFRDANVQFTVTLPDSLETIGGDTFRNYTHLRSLTIPENVASIEADTFYNCIDLEEINVLNENITISPDSGIEHTKWYKNQPDGEVFLGNCLIGIKNISENQENF